MKIYPIKKITITIVIKFMIMKKFMIKTYNIIIIQNKFQIDQINIKKMIYPKKIHKTI